MSAVQREGGELKFCGRSRAATFVVVLAAALLFAQRLSAQQRDDATFEHAAREIKVGASRRQVRQILGAPDKRNARTWTYRSPPDRPDGPFHWFTFTFSRGKVSKIEDGSVGCVLYE
jgi:hypothetical protein